VGITLAPTSPPRVQLWTMTPVRLLSPQLESVVTSLARMIAAPDGAALRAMLGADVDAAAASRRLAAASAWGSCRVDVVVAGDGQGNASVRLACTAGSLDLSVETEPATGKLRRLSLVPSGNRTCVP
jgi:hypothetical protein